MTAPLAAETTQTIEEFTALKPKWGSLVGSTLQVEGRYSIFAPSQLRMENCPLDFVMASDFQSPAGDSRTILLKGRLEKREAKLVFVISELLPQPSDVERFRSLKGKIASNKPEEWFKLAEWGTHRGEYYRDEALKKEAAVAFKQGVQAEYREMFPVTAKGVRGLAQKLASRKIDPQLEQEYLHEALRLDYNTFLKENRSEDGEILTLLTRQLPGADVPLTPEDEPLRQAYLDSPLVKFNDGDEAQRKKCARVFYVEVLKNRILKNAAPDGKNGFDIADRIEKQLPEYQSLAPEYREKQYNYYLNQAGSLSRKDLGDLVTKLEPLDNPEFIETLKQRWLTEKEKRIDHDNVIELVDLGDDYMIIKNDRDTAINFYKKAYALAPNTQAISDWLKDQGLSLQGGVWLAKGEAPPELDDPIAASVRAGVVRVGMTGEQVKSTLGGDPTSRTKIATGAHFQEWWVYEEHGLSIEFTRRRRPESPLVTKVISQKQKTRPVKIAPEKPSGSGGF